MHVHETKVQYSILFNTQCCHIDRKSNNTVCSHLFELGDAVHLQGVWHCHTHASKVLISGKTEISAGYTAGLTIYSPTW